MLLKFLKRIFDENENVCLRVSNGVDMNATPKGVKHFTTVTSFHQLKNFLIRVEKVHLSRKSFHSQHRIRLNYADTSPYSIHFDSVKTATFIFRVYSGKEESCVPSLKKN